MVPAFQKVNPISLSRASLQQDLPTAAGGGFDWTERAGTRSDGRKQGRHSADGCGEGRAILSPACAASGGVSNGRLPVFQIDDGWWRGECRGVYGLFPANYVELL